MEKGIYLFLHDCVWLWVVFLSKPEVVEVIFFLLVMRVIFRVLGASEDGYL